jgi:hypothetical protein
MDFAMEIKLVFLHAHQIMIAKVLYVNLIFALELAKINLFIKAILII